MKALPDTRSFVEILLSPLRPGEPERRLLVVASGSIDLLTSKLLLCQYGSGLAIATSSGDVLVSLVNAWRDEDEARGKIAGIRLHVGGNHPEVDAAILLLSVVGRHLRFNAEEHPVALQLGGSDAAELASAARLGEQWGYDEINLNCGCPSDRVQRGAFGACLMAEPQTVADGVKAMVDAVSIPVTVKHRIGIDRVESYDFVRDFVGTVSEAGCGVFLVHARNAWLDGLSPKENREIPPLRYELAHRLKQDFPQLTFAINGGFTTNAQIAEHLRAVDGVMVGREAYHNPWVLTGWDEAFFGAAPSTVTREAVEEQMVAYMERAFLEDGCPWYAIARHMLGLRHGLRGARRWRQVWSDHRLKPLPPREVWAMAQAHVGQEAETDGLVGA